MGVIFSALWALLLLTSTQWVYAVQNCDNPNSSQRELNECYDKLYKQSDAELNVLYKLIVQHLKGDKNGTELLVKAQSAWLSYRDAECDFFSFSVAQGSVYPMILLSCLNSQTQLRINDFQRYLRCEEGNLSCSVPGG